jgi:HD-GYP domain-containing protein (c-di-GMP phosphodiesterase class II)
VAIGRKAGMNAVQLENLRIAGLLHDMGKIGIPDNLLHKPGRLTDEEFELVKNHSQLGAEILKPIPSLEDVIPGILHHHERIDGGGYPFGLKEEQIPPTAQILAVADTYDALVTDRPYRRGMPKEQALTIMKEVAGAQLSNYYVRLFREWLGE